ncbi:MAG: ATP-binding protein [Solirubrobacterales bacterium]|nr:ATP-binding protein [Solirubrobacterales bacterium]
MIAIALGLKAVEAGYRVHYTTAADLVARTSRAADQGRWENTMRFWAGPQVLIVDLCRYCDYADVVVVVGVKALFWLVSRRSGRLACRHSHRPSRNARVASLGL